MAKESDEPRHILPFPATGKSSPDRLRLMVVDAKRAFCDAVGRRSEWDVAAMEMVKPDFAPPATGGQYHPMTYPEGSKLNFRSIAALRQAVFQFRPQVIHAFYPRSLAHAVVAVTGMPARPRIVSYRGIVSPLSKWDPVDRLTYLSGKVDAHACESEAVRECMLAAGLASESCRVIYNCLDDSVKPMNRALARAQWNVPGDAFVVATVANMRPVKGIDLLLKAALAWGNLPESYLVLMGRVDDPEIERLASDPRLAGRLRMTGFHAEASHMVAAADVFVMPSRSEALCVALLEAMSHGVCPVVSDAGGMKEVVRHGRDGLVLPKENVPALAETIRMLYGRRDLVREFGESSRRRIAEDFSPAMMAERAVGIYDWAMAGGGARRRAA